MKATFASIGACLTLLLGSGSLTAAPVKIHNKDEPFLFSQDEASLVDAAFFLRARLYNIGILQGRASWIDEPREDGRRPGVFEVDASVWWDFQGAKPDAGHRIGFDSPSRKDTVAMWRMRTTGLGNLLRGNLDTGEEHSCLLILLQLKDSDEKPEEHVYSIDDPDAAFFSDLVTAAEIGRALPGIDKSDEFLADWRHRVTGPIGTSVLLRALRLSDPTHAVNPIKHLEFALEVIEGGDERLHKPAINLLRTSPAELLRQLPDARLRSALLQVSGTITEAPLPASSIVARLTHVADLSDRLPGATRRELSAHLLEQFAQHLDAHYASINEAAREREVEHRQELQQLGIPDPLDSYNGPGRTPDEGRWIELRQRLEAMARYLLRARRPRSRQVRAHCGARGAGDHATKPRAAPGVLQTILAASQRTQTAWWDRNVPPPPDPHRRRDIPVPPHAAPARPVPKTPTTPAKACGAGHPGRRSVADAFDPPPEPSGHSQQRATASP